VLDVLQELVDQSLLRLSSDTGQTRYAMLETVREFAAERLAELPEADLIHAAHAAVFAALAQRIERPPIWPDNEFLALLDRDHDNLRAGLDWLTDHDRTRALMMAARLTAFWSVRGHFTEGRQRLHDLLNVVRTESRERVAGLNGAGWLAFDQGDLEVATSLLDESVQVARAIHDPVGEGTALLNRGRTVMGVRGHAQGGQDIAQAIDVLTRAEDAKGVAAAMLFHGLAPQLSGDLDLARARFEACAARCEELGLTTLRARRYSCWALPGCRAAMWLAAVRRSPKEYRLWSRVATVSASPWAWADSSRSMRRWAGHGWRCGWKEFSTSTLGSTSSFRRSRWAI
jgi:non-specific serine/threonine protein kinase